MIYEIRCVIYDLPVRQHCLTFLQIRRNMVTNRFFSTKTITTTAARTIAALLFFLWANAVATQTTVVERGLIFDPQLAPFYHGVASGDPTAEGFTVWTRLTPDSTVQSEVELDFAIAKDVGFQDVVQTGTVLATAQRDYTAKANIVGLLPDTYYYYHFTAPDGRHSLVGRAKNKTERYYRPPALWGGILRQLPEWLFCRLRPFGHPQRPRCGAAPWRLYL
jgi:hypothetical protein